MQRNNCHLTISFPGEVWGENLPFSHILFIKLPRSQILITVFIGGKI